MSNIISNPNPFPCIPVKLITLPPDIVLEISHVVLLFSGFFVLAETTSLIYGPAIFRAGFRKLFEVFSLPSKFSSHHNYESTSFHSKMFRSKTNHFLTFTSILSKQIMQLENTRVFIYFEPCGLE